jgi:oxygen-independent coproporphyrinogen-3 oxidase
MAGIYIHIPFCKQACHYCNFHFATSLHHKDRLLLAIQKELEMQSDYFEDNSIIKTVYFGGGTPSLLTADEINRIIDTIYRNFRTELLEVTFEANPDDLTKEYLISLQDTAINRLSIGVQSFFDVDLKWMNRAHNHIQAFQCIENALHFGFKDLSVDLIYGSPTTTNEMWYQNLRKLIESGVEHISAYCLTVEERAPLNKLIKSGKSKPVDSTLGATQFEIMIEELSFAGFEQYEISNFAKNKKYALHNTSYWQGAQYLGVGPSAHSFNGRQRSWNISNNQIYIQSIEEDELLRQSETLSVADIFNELVMTGLRTMWGVNSEKLKEVSKLYFDEFDRNKSSLIENGMMRFTDNNYILTSKGKLFADKIASDLFILE